MNDALPENSSEGVEFIMGWYGKPIARMKYSGVDFGFDYENGWMLPLQNYKLESGKSPMFLRNLLPPWQEERSVDKDIAGHMARFFSTQELFLANITVVKDAARLKELKYDYVQTRLSQYTNEDGIFTGTHPDIKPMPRELISNIRKITAEKCLTQMSGSQMKFPLNLNGKGELALATDLPSTHIVKYAGLAGDPEYIRGAAEWIGMSLARSGGVKCSEFALIEMVSEGKNHLHYLTERFDLPVGEDDLRMIFCEELGAAMNLIPRAADVASLNDVIEGIEKISTNVKADLFELFKQVASNCLLENGDFHARNMSIVKVAEPTLDGFRSVRLSPAYDIMRTRDFAKTPIPNCERESMRLTFLNDDYDQINFNEPTISQFVEVGQAMNISEESAEATLLGVALGMAKKAKEIRDNMPKIFDNHDACKQHVLETCDIVIRNAIDLFPEIESSIKLSANSRLPKP